MKVKIIVSLIIMLLVTTAGLSVVEALNVQITYDIEESKCINHDSITQANSPGLITIEIQAKVRSVDDIHNLLGGVINVGDIIYGRYTYDDMTVDTNPLPSVGDYLQTSASCGVVINAGPYIFKTDPSNVNFLIEIINNHGTPPWDNYLWRSYNNLPLSNGVIVDHISWQLDDDTASAIDSTDLPTTAPNLNDWTQPSGLDLLGYDPFNPSEDYSIDAIVTKATKSKARIINGVESSWSSNQATITRNKIINTPFLNWLQNHPNMFPILGRLFQRLV